MARLCKLAMASMAPALSAEAAALNRRSGKPNRAGHVAWVGLKGLVIRQRRRRLEQRRAYDPWLHQHDANSGRRQFHPQRVRERLDGGLRRGGRPRILWGTSYRGPM
jgi:hypothetical protein